MDQGLVLDLREQRFQQFPTVGVLAMKALVKAPVMALVKAPVTALQKTSATALEKELVMALEKAPVTVLGVEMKFAMVLRMNQTASLTALQVFRATVDVARLESEILS
ncbi:hypothetical protein Hypma_014105 [Hypsizygus marmoreus]|uniref:Uncharacterized protein n=1 Tax=Hypsizygus marmoreus TaxID=39966 RepID=A0A369KB74_HYPMA|nr:hypothetical protein Hypma_014105 [Hypsizygus marmoreus]